MKEYNLNKGDVIYAEDYCSKCNDEVAYKLGAKEVVRVKIGRTWQNVSLYYTNNELSLFCGDYGNGDGVVIVRNDAILDREFFENIEEIAKATKIVRKYSYTLRGWPLNFREH